ncbi:MAG: Gfo/Idh/MocA family oxidoreductase [Rhizobiaceae bacterium]
MNRTRLALIGAGVIGQRHLAAIAQVPDVELVAIADPSPASEKLAGDLNAAHFADSVDLLEVCRPDGVIIATPTEHHLMPVIAALESGAHVLVEKPIMATLEECEQTIATANSADRHVLVGHHRRYYGLVNQARDLIRQGRLGQLVGVVGQWNVRKHADYYAPDWRQKWQAGPILTNLIHDMDLLRYIAGDIVSISAETSNSVMGFEKEDAAAMVMRFENGALGTFLLSDQSHSPWSWEQATGENAAFPRTGENPLRFMGTEGSLEFPNLKLWSSDAEAEWRTPLSRADLSNSLEDAFVNQISHFHAVVQGRELPRITAQDATDTLKATLAVYQSAQSSSRIEL